MEQEQPQISGKLLDRLAKAGWNAASSKLDEKLNPMVSDVHKYAEVVDTKSEKVGRKSIIPGIATGLAIAVAASIFAPATLAVLGGTGLALLGSAAGAAGGYFLGKNLSTVDKEAGEKLTKINTDLEKMIGNTKMPPDVWEAFKNNVEREARDIVRNTPSVTTNQLLQAFYKSENPEIITFEVNGEKSKQPVITLKYDISKEMADRYDYVQQCLPLEAAQAPGKTKPAVEMAKRPETAVQAPTTAA